MRNGRVRSFSTRRKSGDQPSQEISRRGGNRLKHLGFLRVAGCVGFATPPAMTRRNNVFPAHKKRWGNRTFAIFAAADKEETS
jgi:hypothetical protein